MRSQIFLFAAWLVGIMFTVAAILVSTLGKADRNIWNIPPTKCMFQSGDNIISAARAQD